MSCGFACPGPVANLKLPQYHLDPCGPDPAVAVRILATAAKDVLLVVGTTEGAFYINGTPLSGPSGAVFTFQRGVPAGSSIQLAWVPNPLLQLPADSEVPPLCPANPCARRNTLQLFTVNGVDVTADVYVSRVPGTELLYPPPVLPLNLQDVPTGVVITYVPPE
jgi:hypothetical protein